MWFSHSFCRAKEDCRISRLLDARGWPFRHAIFQVCRRTREVMGNFPQADLGPTQRANDYCLGTFRTSWKSPGLFRVRTAQPAAIISVHPSPSSVEPSALAGAGNVMLLWSSGRRTWAASSTPHAAFTWTRGNTVPAPGMGTIPEFENEPLAFGNTSTGPSTNRLRSSATLAL